MTIQEILALPDINDRITQLKKGRDTDLPDIDTFTNQLDPSKHDVMNPAKRPDKIISERDDDGNIISTEVIKVARSPLALQRIIVESAVSFLYGSEPKLVPSDTDPSSKALFDAIVRNNKDVKINTINRQTARIAKSFTEVAEYWYLVPVEKDKKYSKYGFDSPYKLKCKVFDPSNGDTLYPFFNEYGDMTAFSRAFQVTQDDKKVDCFEVWTNEVYARWIKDSTGGWIEQLPEGYVKMPLNKIPIAYISVPNEWSDVQELINRLETILSNLGDTNDYFSSPILFIKGALQSMAKKGEPGKIIQGDTDSSAEYISWTNAPESTKMEVEFILSQIFGLTSTADLSTQGTQDQGIPASGEAFRMRFLGSMLKVMRDMEYFDAYLTRRVNIQKAFFALINKQWGDAAEMLDIDHIVTPYMVDTVSDTINTIIDAVNGGIMSKRTGVSQNPLIDNAEEELNNIKEEQTSAAALDEQQNEDI
jgi:hypothetical protein